MDIRKWLDETVTPVQSPIPPNQFNLAPCLRPKEDMDDPRASRKYRKSRSGSSLLERRPIPPRKTLKCETSAEHSTNSSDCSEAHDPTSRTSSSRVSSQRYARKARRKTRTDRYDPTVNNGKTRETHIYRNQIDESKKRKRKPKRKRSDKSGVGLVQSFRAKNVSQDRLTLRPRDNLGLFNKGKAASPIKGRGLPDLVFSEMKFLQKHRAQPEPALDAELSRKHRKKSHTQVRDEEISAYFTSVRPALQEQIPNIQANESHRPLDPRACLKQHDRDRSSLTANAFPTVESPAVELEHSKFRNRVPQHDSGSYISWSESIRPWSKTPLLSQSKRSSVHRDRLDSVQLAGGNLSIQDEASLQKPVSPAAISKKSTHENSHIRPVFSFTPVACHLARSKSVPLASALHHQVKRCKEDEIRTHNTGTLQSPMVGHAPSPKAVSDEVPCEVPRDVGVDADSKDRKSDGSFPAEHEDAGQGIRETTGQSEKEKDTSLELHTPSGLEKLIRECNAALNQRTHDPPKLISTDAHPPRYGRVNSRSPGPDVGSYTTLQRLPTVRFAGGELRVPMFLNFTEPSIYKAEALRGHDVNGLEGASNYLYREMDTLESNDVLEVGDDIGYEYDEREQIISGANDRPISWMPYGRCMVGQNESGPGLEEDDDYGRDNQVCGNRFWRPNKLY
ncbi:hypothetical protein BU24DRAFT_493884 [Aaosphaeria arxii CBS 175.79]|uniref:Uncharacterized protein n=1 Tax=Aaosphaeria arxii CBS 175.79 TaxID=1450172 RepID=A0A6A5XKA3_9PLEO|nr:uncharacterized protein BU24DRAFT_493884 [Aaosphaeria arxii CBS 175.79]KAF2013383.1 hypothetical protein BU24DRAFT_493884 [Aaosphaeria arxii CBS 175.79]